MRFLVLILLASMLSGCGTIGAVRKAVFGDPTIDGKDKIEYAKKIEEYKSDLDKLKTEQKQFIIFQYLGAGLIVIGLLMVVLGKTNTALGVACAITGFICSGWGLTATKLPSLVIVLMCIGIVAGVLYVANAAVLQWREKKTIKEQS